MDPHTNAGIVEVPWQARFYREGDIPALAELISTADRADGVYKQTGEEDLRDTFETPGLEPERRVIVVEGPKLPGVPQGLLLGFGRAFPSTDKARNERIYNVALRVRPEARQYGLEREIARRLVELARQHEAEAAPGLAPASKVRLRTYLFDTHTSARSVWEQTGLRRVRTGWTMLRPLDDSLADPQPVEGVTLRTYRRPEDNAATLQALNSSFADNFDFQPLSDSRWEYAMSASYVRPDLSWVAEPSDEPGRIVGFSVCWITEEENERTGRKEGWVEGLGVVREWRRQGIGRALLLNSLHSLRSAGMEAALADVDSESEAPTRLFQLAGFGVRNSLSQYECYLDEVTV
ncbi:MAG: GNAT family N-acetyltransferase [Chloroflexota bacterium]|nr:GNAT family N-acetyltransferase [Chloroflexota bacterium]